MEADHVSTFLPDEFETLAEILKKEGYKTLGYSNNSWVGFDTGLSRNFDDFQESWKPRRCRYFYSVAYNILVDFVNRNNPDWR